MIEGDQVRLRPICSEDWQAFEKWGESRDALWGAYQRFQLDHLPVLRQAFQETGLLSRQSGFLMIHRIKDGKTIGFVRYTLVNFPDVDFPHPEIGFAITDAAARGHGFAREAVLLMVEYLFSGYSAERISAITDAENLPSQTLLESLGFQREGLLRRSSFRDGSWRDMLIYGLLRLDWQSKEIAQTG